MFEAVLPRRPFLMKLLQISCQGKRRLERDSDISHVPKIDVLIEL